MRTIGPALALGLVLLAGCSSTQDDSPEDDGAAPTPAPASACDEVRAGIDAFNVGDYAETVQHFRVAVPLAEDQARNDHSRQATDLVEAVTYYAELAPEDYPEAARSSDDFATYQAITLGQCVPVAEPDTEPPPVTT